MNFLRPGEEEDEEVWAKIKRNWVGYLSATSPTPEVALAPNRKVVQFTGGDEDDDGTSLVGFIAYLYSEGMLEEIGLQLTESQIDDILDIKQEIWQIDIRAIAQRQEKGGFEDIWVPIW
ncbi:hypothetical protein FOXYSP1_08384 [Fusarium oxysporum f. sp. phaseoli]